MASSPPSTSLAVPTPNQQAHQLLLRLLERVGFTKRQFLDRLADLGYPFSDDDFANWGRAGRAFPRSWTALRAMVQLLVENQPSSRRCTASEALQFLGLVGMPFPELPPLGSLFPPDELQAALASYMPVATALPAGGVTVDSGGSAQQSGGEVAHSRPPRASGTITTGLQALHRLLQTRDVHDTVVMFQGDFRAACEQIERLAGYKHLHDRLQQLEDHYYLLYHDHQRLPTDAAAWPAIARHAPGLELLIDDVTAAAQAVSTTSDTNVWLEKLEQAREHLRCAIEDGDYLLLRSATMQLKDVLGREPSRINTRLVTTAHAMRLTALVHALAMIRDRLAALDLDADARGKLGIFSEAVDSLGRISAHVSRAIGQHNLFQVIDDELRRVEALLDQDPRELSYAWEQVRPLTERLCESNGAAWAARLQATSAALDQWLPSHDAPQLLRLFRRYRSQAVRAFNQVDSELLALCGQLREIGEPLTVVLRMVR